MIGEKIKSALWDLVVVLISLGVGILAGYVIVFIVELFTFWLAFTTLKLYYYIFLAILFYGTISVFVFLGLKSILDEYIEKFRENRKRKKEFKKKNDEQESELLKEMRKRGRVL